MRDRDLIEKRLAFVVTCVADLRRHANPDSIEADPVPRRFIERTLQLAIQAMLDATSATVSSEHLGEPQTNHQLLEILAQAGWVPAEDVNRFRRIVGFRNVLVHQVLEVDPLIVREVSTERLDDLLEFVSTIRTRLED